MTAIFAYIAFVLGVGSLLCGHAIQVALWVTPEEGEETA